MMRNFTFVLALIFGLLISATNGYAQTPTAQELVSAALPNGVTLENATQAQIDAAVTSVLETILEELAPAQNLSQSAVETLIVEVISLVASSTDNDIAQVTNFVVEVLDSGDINSGDLDTGAIATAVVVSVGQIIAAGNTSIAPAAAAVLASPAAIVVDASMM